MTTQDTPLTAMSPAARMEHALRAKPVNQQIYIPSKAEADRTRAIAGRPLGARSQ